MHTSSSTKEYQPDEEIQKQIDARVATLENFLRSAIAKNNNADEHVDWSEVQDELTAGHNTLHSLVLQLKRKPADDDGCLEEDRAKKLTKVDSDEEEHDDDDDGLEGASKKVTNVDDVDDDDDDGNDGNDNDDSQLLSAIFCLSDNESDDNCNDDNQLRYDDNNDSSLYEDDRAVVTPDGNNDGGDKQSFDFRPTSRTSRTNGCMGCVNGLHDQELRCCSG